MQLVNHVYFSPDGQWVASASFDKSLKLWNGITGKFVAAFRGHVGPVYQIRFDLFQSLWNTHTLIFTVVLIIIA
jgi:ribosome assembly protein 4